MNDRKRTGFDESDSPEKEAFERSKLENQENQKLSQKPLISAEKISKKGGI